MGQLQEFISELKRRRVFRVLVGWGVFSFAVLQIYEPVMHGLHLPDWTLSVVVLGLAAGFPATVVLAWIFDIKTGGIEITRPAVDENQGSPGSSRPRRTRFVLLLVGLGVVAAVPGLVYFLVSRGGIHLEHVRMGTAEEKGGQPDSSIAPSVAVLPFTDMSPQKDQEYLADGLAEEILNALAQVEGLNVAGRTSSFSFKGRNEDLRIVGQKLNVATILEGSVRKSGSTIRVTAQIVKAADGFHLWSKTFERDLTNIFAVEDEIARAVVEALKVKLLPGRSPSIRERQTSSPEAYEEYLRGVELLSRYGRVETPKAQAAFEKAIALDPNYGLAWSELSMALALISDWASTADQPDLQTRALAAADKGVGLAPDLAISWARRAILRMQIRWDWPGAGADIDRALKLNPRDVTANEAQARFLAARGQLAEAIAAGRKVIELDHLNLAGWLRLHTFYVAGGSPDLAHEALERAKAIGPTSINVPVVRALVELREGRAASALAMSRLPEMESPDSKLIAAAMAHYSLGQPKESQQALDTLIAGFAESDAYQVAEIYAWRGEREKAFEWLERAYRQRDGGLVAVLPWVSPVKWNPVFRGLHDDPRYSALLRKMNLPVE